MSTVSVAPETATFYMARALEALGLDLSGDLLETPGRWVKAFREMTAGYALNPEDLLAKRFHQPAADELVILRDIAFTSLCEHHLLPFSGVAHVGYIPGGYVIGLSKLARLVDCFAQRLQVQERMTHGIAHALMQALETRAVGVVLAAHHSCMGCRGVKKPAARMITSCLLGDLRKDAALRQEFLSLIR